MVSVLVPVYNVQDFLPKCIDSILGQTYADFELILVDDGSADESGRICDEYALKDDRIKVFHRTNHGIGATREFALQHTQGEYIMWVDSDDWIEPDMMALMVQSAEAYQSDIVTCNLDVIEQESSLKIEHKGCSTENYKRELIASQWAVLWRHLFRRSFLLDIDVHFPKEINNGEDYYFVVKCFLSTESVSFVDKILYHYNRLNSNSTITNVNKRKTLEQIEATRLIEIFLKEKALLETYRKELLFRKYIAKEKLLDTDFMRWLVIFPDASIIKFKSLFVMYIKSIIKVVRTLRDKIWIYLSAWGYFKHTQRELERTFENNYYSEDGGTSQETCVVFVCDGRSWHGGLADRLKGLLGLFAYCNERNFPFRISFTHPFHLKNYLVPNNYDWQIGEMPLNKNASVPKFCMLDSICGNSQISKNIDKCLDDWLRNNIKLERKQQHVYTNMCRRNIDYAFCFNQLFKPAAQLQSLLDYHLSQLGEEYISVSFRFAKLLGDFTDSYGSVLAENEQQSLIDKSVTALETIIKNERWTKKVLVTADSIRFLSRIGQNKQIYIIPGIIGHIDFENEGNVVLKTFQDFLMISKAKIVYLAKGPDMYSSEFSRTAALIGNCNFKTFLY